MGSGRIFSFFVDYTGRGPDGEISYENPWFLEGILIFALRSVFRLKV